ncbi:MAG TPA: hypothetical protein PKY78_07580 [Candidatus Omnitrophota bacterium]|nr:hypothetical protein [Candidatus Omnitrophota bacterium]HPS20827.1 hypothetical protein [Candidatus Omnitrophota bacterium]
MDFVKMGRKHTLLVVSSSLIITVVFVATFIGYNVYMQWVEDTISLRYRDSIYKLTAGIYKNDIVIMGVVPKAGKEIIFSGSGAGMPLLEGKVKNNTSKIITSVMVEIYFSRSDGSVVYRDWFYPLGEKMFFSSPFFSSKIKPQMVLPPGETMTFRYLLRNCPAEIASQLMSKKGFSKEDPGKEIKMNLKVAGVSVL